MKLRWREHEALLAITLVIAMFIHKAKYLEVFQNENSEKYPNFDAVFNYYLPQIAICITILLIYFLTTQIIVKQLIKIKFSDFENFKIVEIAKIALLIITSGAALAFIANVITSYAYPHLVNYSNYQFLALFGYNDKPLTNFLSGADRAIMLLICCSILFRIREYILNYFEREDSTKIFRITIINSISAILYVYISIPLLVNVNLEIYASFLPLIVFYFYLTYWVFPNNGEKLIANKPVIVKTIIAAIIASIVFYFIERNIKIVILYFIQIIVIVVPIVLILYKRRKDTLDNLAGLQSKLAVNEATLSFHRSQINPHFLFNALNTLYGTALMENSETTANGIQKLGDMMRFMLVENTQDFITMEKELEYLRNYIDLQKLRTQSSDLISIEDNIDEVKCINKITPMILIPFVENAFKHGISLKDDSWIKIELSCEMNHIQFTVSNSNHKKTKDPEKEHGGIGLENVKQRLKLIYPKKHNLYIVDRENEFTIKLEIQC